MKNLFKPQTIQWILILLAVLAGIKLFWVIVELNYLPVAGINQSEEVRGKALYYKVKLSSNKPAPKKKVVKKAPVGNIKQITLLAVYNAPDMTVVTVRYKGKTKVLAGGEEINGFMLEGGGATYATFSKNEKMYRVDLVKGKHNSKSSIRPAKVRSHREERVVTSRPKGEVTDVGDHKIVDRSLIDHYTKNLDDIYKNIGITDIKIDGRVTGFRVSFVKRGSPFAKLGLRRGDVIKSVNGQEMNSYSAAFGVYRNMKEIESLTLTIMRGKKEMELEYEIN